MMLNDSLGDCTAAGVGHLEQVATNLAQGSPWSPTDSQVLKFYESYSGYNPRDPNSDQGATLIAALRSWHQGGLGGHRIRAWATINIHDLLELRQGCFLFGGLYTAVQLPLAWQGAPSWDVATGPNGEPGSWGGHCVAMIGYTDVGPVVVSWGSLVQVTWDAWNKYFIEAHGVIPDDFDKVAFKLAGLNEVSLLKALNEFDPLSFQNMGFMGLIRHLCGSL